jgi:hypothetical protein
MFDNLSSLRWLLHAVRDLAQRCQQLGYATSRSATCRYIKFVAAGEASWAESQLWLKRLQACCAFRHVLYDLTIFGWAIVHHILKGKRRILTGGSCRTLALGPTRVRNQD